MAGDLHATASVWTAAGGRSRTGLFPGRVSLSPQPVRRLPACAAIQASVVFDAENRAFVADMAGWVQAFTEQGEPLWQRELAGGISASPAADAEGGRVFLGTHSGWVCALQSTNGALLWQRRLPTRTDARILSDLLYVPARRAVVVSSWGGQFHELDAASGDSKHTWEAGLWPQAGATADARGNLYCLRARRGVGVECVRISTGGMESTLHRRPESGRGANRMAVAAAPVVDELRGVAYFIANGDRDCELHAWSLREQRHLWKRGLARTVLTTPALSPDGHILLADMAGVMHALALDGAEVFRYVSGAEYLISSPVCVADGRAFVGDPLGRLHVVNRTGGGGPVFEATRSIQARPAFDRHGSLYVSASDRMVHVFANQECG